MANNILAKMAVQISANTAEFNKALAKTNKDINSFTDGIKNVAGVLGVAFSVQQVASFGLEVAKLAGQAEAVEGAFHRLRNSTKLLIDMKEATGNTVSELELMKRAVQASNFDISLEALPRLLEFATLRAQQTGQSVDYLVDSIVTGIGRKSKLILDNLGISAVQLTEALGGASAASSSIEDVANAVGRIAEKNLANMEKFSQNASTAVQQLGAAWDDLRVSIGKLVNSSGLPTFIKELSEIARFFAGDFTLSKEQVQKTEVALGALIQQSKELGNQKDVIKYTKMLAELVSQYGLLKDQSIEPTTKAIDEQTESVKKLNKEFERGSNVDSLTRKKFEGPLQLRDMPSAIGSLINPDQVAIDVKKSVDHLETLPVSFRPIADEMVEISGLVSGGIAEIANAFGEASVSPKQFGKNIINAMAGFAQQFGAVLIAAGVGKIAFDKFSGPGMIAAGAALVALGGAVRSVINKKPSLGGGGSQNFPERNVSFAGQNGSLSFSTELAGTTLQLQLGNQGRRDQYTKP